MIKKLILILPLILILSACSTSGNLGLKQNNLPYWQKLDSRSTADINLLVIHATELSDLKEARQYGERILYDDGTGASGHYYIDRDGYTEQYVPENRVAHHTSGWNSKSLSVELINRGRYPNWYMRDSQVMREPYSKTQIDALITLISKMTAKYPTIKYIQGHEDLDRRKVKSDDDPDYHVERKMDPGNYFPWVDVIERSGLIKAIPPEDIEKHIN